MSRPQKIHKPIKGGFNEILASIAAGTGKGKQAAKNLLCLCREPPRKPRRKKKS